MRSRIPLEDYSVNALLRESLDRTLRLMRDDLVDGITDAELITELTSTEIVLAGDKHNLSSHAAQCAYITAALLMARSGHRVYIAAPNVRLRRPQSPLKGNRLINALRSVSADLLPDVAFAFGAPSRPAALCVCFGNSPQRYDATRVIRVNASAWDAELTVAAAGKPWVEEDWPCGALAAGGMAAVEAFKATMHRVRSFARAKDQFDALFAFSNDARIELAPANTPHISALGIFDFISGGAITNGTLFTFARLPQVTGQARVIEPECSDLSNLNRYMLLLRSATLLPKGPTLASLMPPGLILEAVQARYEGTRMPLLGNLAPAVLVGADDIPTRWKAQAENPAWLGIGATSHWNTMASYHVANLACAQCLHPRDEHAAAPLPTVAFVSFFVGLMLACYFLRMKAGERLPPTAQYVYLTPFRVEGIWHSPVARRDDCPTCGTGQNIRAA